MAKATPGEHAKASPPEPNDPSLMRCRNRFSLAENPSEQCRGPGGGMMADVRFLPGQFIEHCLQRPARHIPIEIVLETIADERQ